MAATPPTSADLVAWLGNRADTIPADLLEEALEVALERQAAECVVDPYSASLRYAALRRAARHLAARPHALGTVDSGDFGASRIARWDAEVTTHEAPYLRGGIG